VNDEGAMLSIERPRTRAECRAEARPCPWVGCRHHLLLELAMPMTEQRKDPRAMTLRLNAPAAGRVRYGRRPGLHVGAAANVVRAWIDDAVAALMSMPYTCALDVADDFPDGLSSRDVGLLLGVSEQGALKLFSDARKSAAAVRLEDLEP
jgi:hypothetical protein